MAVALEWQGPIGPGRIPEDALVFERLCEAGVYLRIKTYATGRVVAYAGQSVSLLARFDQHLSLMLSLAVPLRDADGGVCFSGDAAARLAAYGDVSTFAGMAAADVARVRFFYALCDPYFHKEHLNLAERLLQHRIAQRIADVENAAAAPGRVPDDVPDVWENDFSALAGADRVLLENLLGGEPLVFRQEVAGGA